MHTDDPLDVVDAFEARHGNGPAIRRACEFLVSYLSSKLDRLSETALRGLEVATRHQSGRIGLTEVKQERLALANFLTERSGWTGWEHPDYGPVHAVFAILWHTEDPTRGGGASELISNALTATASLEVSDDLARSLLNKHFSA
jgi:hypothetical protein